MDKNERLTLCAHCDRPHGDGRPPCLGELYPPLTREDRERLLMTLFEGYEELLAEERIGGRKMLAEVEASRHEPVGGIEKERARKLRKVAQSEAE